jgi:hypothetical protein
MSFDASLEYKFTHQWKLFVRYADRATAFYDSELPGNHRLFYNESRAEGGVGYALGDYVNLEAGVGYAFAREFSVGFDDRNLDRVTDVSSEPFAHVGLAVHY